MLAANWRKFSFSSAMCRFRTQKISRAQATLPGGLAIRIMAVQNCARIRNGKIRLRRKDSHFKPNRRGTLPAPREAQKAESVLKNADPTWNVPGSDADHFQADFKL
jgi:hypothetical protein